MSRISNRLVISCLESRTARGNSRVTRKPKSACATILLMRNWRVMNLEGIDHVALSVRDVERSAQWYIDVLGFERRHEGMWDGVPVFIGKGTTSLALFPAKSDERSTSSLRGGVRMLHLALRADRKNFLAA